MVQPDKTLPDPSRPDQPWAIVGVIDDEPFGYTNGLEDFYGHAELWMGHAADNDPLALQWCVRDIAFWLNHLAGKVRDGRAFVPGDVVQNHARSIGLALSFVIGEPAGRDALEALLLPPSALVLPVSWCASWLAGPPPSWPRNKATGGVRRPCDATACPHCEAENRAARRAKRRRK